MDPYRLYLVSPTPDGLEGEDFPETLEPYYSAEDSRAALVELRRLLEPYKCRLGLGNRHHCPSPAWRDEYISSAEHSGKNRFALRVHLYERRGAEGAGGASWAGRYLGFACLRPADGIPRDGDTNDFFNYVTEAELVCPPHMLRPRYHLIQTTASSARLGVLPFRSTVFMTPNSVKANASTCVHVAVTQALHLISGEFNCRPISQGEFDVFLWKRKHHGQSLADILEDGASLDDALAILSEKCDAGGFIADFSRRSGVPDDREIVLEAHRCLTDTLANGLPVILMVNTQRFLPNGAALRARPHAVLLFGMHLLHCCHETGRAPEDEIREDVAELPGLFIGHDPFYGAYAEWSVRLLLQSALEGVADEDGRGIRFLALGPSGVTLGLHDVRREARSLIVRRYGDDPTFFDTYRTRYGLENCPRDPAMWRLVTRLMTTQELEARYGRDGALTSAAEWISRSSYYWCVELRLPQYTCNVGSNQDDAGVPQALLVLVFSTNVAHDAERQTHCVAALTHGVSESLSVEDSEDET